MTHLSISRRSILALAAGGFVAAALSACGAQGATLKPDTPTNPTTLGIVEMRDILLTKFDNSPVQIVRYSGDEIAAAGWLVVPYFSNIFAPDPRVPHVLFPSAAFAHDDVVAAVQQHNDLYFDFANDASFYERHDAAWVRRTT